MRAKLDALTSLRFFAALAIMVHHLVPNYIPEYKEKWLWRISVFECFSGVTLFFILSGFVLTYNYLDSLRQPTARKIWDFYVARFARVYPLFLLGFVLVLSYCLPVPPGKPDPGVVAVYNLTLTHAFIPDNDYYFSYNSVSWSVSVEAFFYLMFPLMLFVFLRCRIGTALRAGILANVLLVAWFLVAKHYATDPKFHWYCYISPLSRLFDFGIGICCGIMFMKCSERGRLQWGYWSATCLECASIGLVGVAILSSPAASFGIRLGPLYAVPMALVIFVFAANRGALSRILCWSPFQVLGEASYGMYLLHVTMMFAFNRHRARFGMETLPLWKCCLVVAGLTMVTSILLHYAYERPLRSLIRNWLGSRKRIVAPAILETPIVTVPMKRAA